MKQKLLRLKQPAYEKNLMIDKLRRRESWETEDGLSMENTPTSSPSNSQSSPLELAASGKLLHFHKPADRLTWNGTSETFTVAVGNADQRAPAQQQPIPWNATPVLKGSVKAAALLHV